MKKLPSTFILMALILIIMFLFIGKMMNNAEKDLDKLKQKREITGGANEQERDLNALLSK